MSFDTVAETAPAAWSLDFRWRVDVPGTAMCVRLIGATDVG
jgi:hypothetical protein